MRVWLITIGEPLPIDGACDRLLRTGILAELLAKNGHDVTFWSSTFDHVRKKHRTLQDVVIPINERYRLHLLHSIGYQSNVSLRRCINHRGVARKFSRYACSQIPPDIILCSLPIVELCNEALNYGFRHGVPVVLDVRDLWPDLFLDLLPPWSRPLGRIVLSPIFRATRNAFARASAIIGVTDKYVEWAERYAGRSSKDWNRAFPMGYVDRQPNEQDIIDARAFWRQHGITGESGEFIACWFGTMGRHSELETVIDGARRLASAARKTRFVLCGVGPHLARLKLRASICPSVVFPGWVNAPQIWTLLRMSSVGLAPYVSNDNYIRNVPNKPVEYLSAGLPIVSSLKGELANLLSRNDCGLTYENGNATDLFQKIVQCYDDPIRLNRLSSNAAQLYRRQFVAEETYSQMEKYFCEIVESHIQTRAA